MDKKITPPTPPKSDLPGKKTPASERRLEEKEEKESKSSDKKEVEKDSEETTSKKEETGEKETGKKEEEGGEEEKEPEPEEEPEEEESDESEIEIEKSVKTGFNLLSPEGVIMMPLAIMLDLVGIILVCFGLDDFGILDIIGIPTIGAWVFFRTGLTPSAPQSTGQKAEKVAKTAEKIEKIAIEAGKSNWLRPVLCGIGEIIPYIGALPFWTYLVYKTLTSDS